MPKEKIALVTGCSTGIGYITSLTLARNGFYTYATMRNLCFVAQLIKIIKSNYHNEIDNYVTVIL